MSSSPSVPRVPGIFMRFYRLLLIASLLSLGPAFSVQAASSLLPRFPTLHDNTIVFEAGGNLWQVGRGGGVAMRLTTDPGFDFMPRFSPDGKWVAFTGQYDDNTDVYVIPAGGGNAKRLTYHSDVVDDAPMRWGADNMVVTWTPDSKGIVFLSRRNTFNSWFGQLFTVPVSGGLPAQLDIPKGGMTSYSPDGGKIAYNRIFRNFRTWKRYNGGLAQDIWIHDFKNQKTTRVTHWKGTDTIPMWYHDTIYFISDRGPQHRMNLWAYDTTNNRFRQITHFDNYDIDWPSLGNNGIVFQEGGSLYVVDLPSEKVHKLALTIPSDDVRTRPRWTDASKQIGSFDISPNGKRALFEARGDIFTVPAKHGDTRDLTRTSNANEHRPAWSPDGKWIAYTTDITGEEQIAIRPAGKNGKEKIITNSKKGYFYKPMWSPDSKMLAVSDNEHVLWYLDINNGKLVKVAHDPYGEIHDFSWSPDGQWLTYSITQPNFFPSIYLYSLKSGKATRISNSMNGDFEPVFSPDGKYLYFLSARHENPTFSESEFNVATLKMTGIYAATLQKNGASPFAPRSDEGVTKDGGTKHDGKAASQAWKPGNSKPVKIDLEGLADRVVPLPVPAADINNLTAADGRIYYMTRPSFTISGPLPGEKPMLHEFDMKERKDKTMVTGLSGYSLSADGSTIVYRQKQKYFLTSSQAKQDNGKPPEPLDLSGMRMQVDPVAEWHEMFADAWRLERDFFFNRQMNGVDWPAVRKKYAKLLPQMGSRTDLNYIIGEMIGELSNSHTYVGGGDMDSPDNHVRAGLLGVDFGLDKNSGRYYFSKIYSGDNSRDEFRSPLTEPGIAVKQGDFLLAVNGRELKAPTNPYSLFVGTLGKTVTLSVADSARGSNRHDVTVRPIHDELQIRLKAWINHNREVVDKASGGKLGYIYLSDMSSDGMDQFIRQFYPQVRKQGLVIDVRWNGGGFIDQILLERLRRVLIGMRTNRQRVAAPTPGTVLHGYMACIINHYSASDGDIFPYYFREYKLGPLIGERTWGGVRGIRGEWQLLDGGYITIPEASLYGLDSQWIIENHGVSPDIEIDNSPGDIMRGKDTQLDTAIKYLMDKIKAHPMALPPAPPLLPAYPPPGHA